jgi:hypothetical protein
VTHRPGRVAAAAFAYDAGERSPDWRATKACAAIGDGILAVLIIAAASVAWSPLLGVAVARDTVASRRAVRARLAEIGRMHSTVWARQMRRNTLRIQRNLVAPRWRTPEDP